MRRLDQGPGIRGGNRRKVRSEVVSQAWIEKAWRDGATDPTWLTLRGHSMSPTLRDGDRILVVPFGASDIPQAGDLVITNRSGTLVAHRLVARTPRGFVTRGDARQWNDTPVGREDLLARVIGVEPVALGAGCFTG